MFRKEICRKLNWVGPLDLFAEGNFVFFIYNIELVNVKEGIGFVLVIVFDGY